MDRLFRDRLIGFTRASSSLTVESSDVDVPEFDFSDIFITWIPDRFTLKKMIA